MSVILYEVLNEFECLQFLLFPKLSIDVMAENKIKNETPHSLESEITEYGEQF